MVNQAKRLRGDVFGGITAAVVALPLSLAFGVASGLGPVAGLYGAIILGFFAALLGGTATQISGPTGPMTVVLASSLVLLDGDINLLASVVLLAGLFQLLLAFLNLGRLVKYIPYPVLSGFMTGIGIIIIIIQLNPLLGMENSASVIQALVGLPGQIMHANGHAVLIGGLTLAIMVLTPYRLSQILPSPLLALLILTPVSVVLELDLVVIGQIPVQLPELIVPEFSAEHFRLMLSLSLTLALLGSIDTLLTSVVADSLTQTRHHSGKELFGQGIGNALCSLVGALPGAGATMRTVVNINSGGTSRVSGMIHACFLLLVLLFLAPFAAQIPLALLAGILIKVGLDIIDYKFLKLIRLVPRSDVIIMLSVLITTVLVDLITAVALGIVVSSLMIVYKLTKDTQITRGQDDELRNTSAASQHIGLIKLNGAFFFGSSNVFEHDVAQMENLETLIIDLSDSLFVDVTAIFMLSDIVVKLKSNGVKIHLVLKERHRIKLLKMNVNRTFDDVHMHSQLDEAHQAALSQLS